MDALINIDVPDLQQAIRFYEGAIGLKLKRRLFDGTVAEMDGAPCPIYLLQKEEHSLALPHGDTARSYARHWTAVHLDFVVDDLDTAIARAQAAGARLESGPQEHAWGRMATFADPFGHGLCLVQWLGRGYDEIA